MEFYADKIHFEITFSHNRWYSYSLKDTDKNNGDLIQDIIDDAENACLRDFNIELVRRVALFACDYFKQRDKEYGAKDTNIFSRWTTKRFQNGQPRINTNSPKAGKSIKKPLPYRLYGEREKTARRTVRRFSLR